MGNRLQWYYIFKFKRKEKKRKDQKYISQLELKTI